MAILKDSCCHCCNVRDGSLVVGVLFLALHVFALAVKLNAFLFADGHIPEIVGAILEAGAIVIDALMIYGVIKVIRKYLFVWVVAAVIITVVELVVVILSTGFGVGGPANLIQFWIVYAVVLVLAIYGTLVVYSYYQNLRDGVVADGCAASPGAYPPGTADGTAAGYEMKQEKPQQV
ncbi:uncharacterized protein LOC144884483 [Branchiostoma floridae x Branchiostoma japonicum]